MSDTLRSVIERASAQITEATNQQYESEQRRALVRAGAYAAGVLDVLATMQDPPRDASGRFTRTPEIEQEIVDAS